MTERDEVERVLGARGERLTRQRAAVLAYLRSTDEHPDARAVHERVRASLLRVSLGTVYRALAFLRDAGLIGELADGPVTRYDANLTGHDHACCERRGRVEDIPRTHAPDLRLIEAGGFRVLRHRLDIQGICRHCQSDVRSTSQQ